MANEELLFGRQLLDFQLPPVNRSLILSRPAMKTLEEEVICERCNTHFLKDDVILPTQNYYCPNCISLGRVTSDASLYYLPEFNCFSKGIDYLVFEGKLTDDQNERSKQVIEVIQKKQPLLLWAVTGAGKTEMMFPGLNYAFKQGMRVCWATPRVDVVLELVPRLKKVFPALKFSVLYGGMEEPYYYSQFVLCTTHQLWRFYRAFDVLIIDEVDSFPYVGNQSLEYGAIQAAKEKASFIYLSATPPEKLTKSVPVAYLPKRFHGRPLSVPITIYLDWRPALEKERLPFKLKKELSLGFKRKERYLIFVSEIQLLPNFVSAFKKSFPNMSCAGVYAGDSKRQEKISKFREGDLEVLFTTTILERGVTIFHINVIVVGAESKVFSWASLVQIAGRAGRAPEKQSDRVIFYFSAYTNDLKKSVKQIKLLNNKAGFDE